MTDPVVLAQRLGEALLAQGEMVTTAESCTGGGVSQAITEVAGSSRWFERGFVTYGNQAKQEMLGVRAATLNRYGAVSEACVREMVAGALQGSRAQVAVAVSGIAGPTGGDSPEKPVGLVWFAWARKGHTTRVQCAQYSGDRHQIRGQAVVMALEGLVQMMPAAIN